MPTDDRWEIRGPVLPDGQRDRLWVAEGRIRWEPVAGARLLAEGVVVPGLVDAHCHVGLGPDGAVGPDEQERQAAADRDAGALLLRDCGSPADTRWIDDRDDLPRILRAGRHLARTRRYLRGFADEMEPDALPDAAELQARRGDGWVKIVADWIDREAGDLAPCWPDDALAEAVRRAHAAGARVTVHAFGESAMPGVLAAGVDCVEHGTGLDGGQLAEMAGRGIALVPTLVQVATFPQIAARAGRFPRYAAHMLALHAGAGALVRAAHAAGVTLLAGTDAGSVQPHGLIAGEVAALAAAGLPARDALAAGSWAARSFLHAPGLDEGDPADLVVYPADPAGDPAVLDGPRLVLLRGRVVRGPVSDRSAGGPAGPPA